MTAGPWIVRNWIWLGHPAGAFFWNSLVPESVLDCGRRAPIPSRTEAISSIPVVLRFLYATNGIRRTCARDDRPRISPVAAFPAGFAAPAWSTDAAGSRWLHSRNPGISEHGRPHRRFPRCPCFGHLALGLAMENSWGVLPAVAMFQACALLAYSQWIHIATVTHSEYGASSPCSYGLEPESEYIGSHVGDYALKGAIAQDVPPGDKIFSFAGRAAAYLERDNVVGYESDGGHAGCRRRQASRTPRRHWASATATSGEVRGVRASILVKRFGRRVAQHEAITRILWGITAVAEANGIIAIPYRPVLRTLAFLR